MVVRWSQIREDNVIFFCLLNSYLTVSNVWITCTGWCALNDVLFAECKVRLSKWWRLSFKMFIAMLLLVEFITVLKSNFSKMNLPNVISLPNLAKMFTFDTKYLKLSSKCSQYRFNAFWKNLPYLARKLGKLSKFASSAWISKKLKCMSLSVRRPKLIKNSLMWNNFTTFGHTDNKWTKIYTVNMLTLVANNRSGTQLLQLLQAVHMGVVMERHQ